MTKVKPVFATKPIPIGPHSRLDVVRREWHTRSGNCYLVSDRHRAVLLLAQRLEPLCAYINDHVVAEDFERVSRAGLYYMAGRDSKRVGVYTKGRFRVDMVDIDAASSKFEDARAAGFESAVVIGDPAYYHISREPPS